MSINQDVIIALKDIGVPVSFQNYTGAADTYITFFTYLDKPEQHADDEETITGHYVQVDVWSKGDYTDLVKAVHEKMLAVSFTKQSFYDLYEEDVNIYHKAMRFFKEVM
ncbi:MAG TPA: hypothetical protein GXX43_03725 [Tepidanaerobacter syntrophicus]|uniref:hypothetical protein n=1 Tax=Tepidanaerobacter syntrophicus TaxID=224999 RepID=UPI00177034BB|nr:hypothetical protein [Tepidanaerobacter syntrophicus]HHV82757.1 hypothetical protein [Tepidanaerobacter syntrophicus]